MNDSNFGICPLCHGSTAKVLFPIKTPFQGFCIVQCRICDLARTFPPPSDQILYSNVSSNYYGTKINKFTASFQQIRNVTMKLRAKYFLSLVPGSVGRPKVLDVGCAEGRLLNAFVEYGCECWGIEHPLYPSQRFQNSDRISYLQDDLQAIDFEKRTFDLVILWHVLEHMDDPLSVIQRLYNLLTPEGIIIIAVPNFSSMESRAFKQFWFHLDIPWHKYHFNEKAIGYLMEKSHLRAITTNTFCLEQGPYGLFQSALNAMGWPKNEFYEALKGNRTRGRIIHFVIQILVLALLLIPGSFVSLLTSRRGKGTVLRLITKKK
jgi:2-polyprenyl-3-methyl-5-hydroxy-6-metoxy-1,4-benzoquinol methylase